MKRKEEERKWCPIMDGKECLYENCGLWDIYRECCGMLPTVFKGIK
jgi:hypothetical protein